MSLSRSSESEVYDENGTLPFASLETETGGPPTSRGEFNHFFHHAAQLKRLAERYTVQLKFC